MTVQYDDKTSPEIQDDNAMAKWARLSIPPSVTAITLRDKKVIYHFTKLSDLIQFLTGRRGNNL